MPIEFHCPFCSRLLRTGEEKAGAEAKCPGCGGSVVVPQQSETAGQFDEQGPGDPFDLGEETPGGEATKTCPICGETIKAAAIKCRYCGEDLGGGPFHAGAPRGAPHRGTLVLVFAILSWAICPIFGIVAWVMAGNDLKEMAAGRMDRDGEGMTNAARIVAMVHVGLTAAILLLYCIFIIGFAAIGAGGGL